jgi:hypothetical protein
MSRKVFAASSTLTERNGHEMKATKALKRHAHVEDLLSDVMERYSAIASDIRQQLLDAKAAVTRAKEAVKLQASSERTSTRKKIAAKKVALKVPPAKKSKKHSKTGRNYEE